MNIFTLVPRFFRLGIEEESSNKTNLGGHVKPLATMLGVGFASNNVGDKIPTYVYHVNGIFQAYFTHWFQACVKMKPIFDHSFNWSVSSLKTIRWCWAYFSFFVLWLKHKKWFELTLSLFHALDSNMKKVSSAFYTFDVLVKNLLKRYRVYFYYFSDSLKLVYEKRTLIESYLSSFWTLKMWKDCRVNLSRSRS